MSRRTYYVHMKCARGRVTRAGHCENCGWVASGIVKMSKRTGRPAAQ